MANERLRFFSLRFADPELERQYQAARWPSDERLFRTTMYVVVLVAFGQWWNGDDMATALLALPVAVYSILVLLVQNSPLRRTALYKHHTRELALVAYLSTAVWNSWGTARVLMGRDLILGDFADELSLDGQRRAALNHARFWDTMSAALWIYLPFVSNGEAIFVFTTQSLLSLALVIYYHSTTVIIGFLPMSLGVVAIFSIISANLKRRDRLTFLYERTLKAESINVSVGTARISDLIQGWASGPSTSKDKLAAFPWVIKASDVEPGEQIGEGGFGVVLKGLWRQQPVALKTIHAGRDLQEFADEIGVLSSLRHPAIVMFLGVVLEADGSLQLVTELLLCSVADIIHSASYTHATRRHITSLMPDAARGLAYLHGLEPPLLHLDIKPANLLLTQAQDAVKLSDLGVATFGDTGGDGDDDSHGGEPWGDDTDAQAPRVIGTLLYAAPEVLLGSGRPSPACDVYSLGFTLFEVSSGLYPFQATIESGVDPRAFMSIVAHSGQRPALQDLEDESLGPVVEACWAVNPEDRCTAADLVKMLQGALLEVTSATDSFSVHRGSVFSEPRSVTSGPVFLVVVKPDVELLWMSDADALSQALPEVQNALERVTGERDAVFSRALGSMALLLVPEPSEVWAAVIAARSYVQEIELPESLRAHPLCRSGLPLTILVEYGRVHSDGTPFGHAGPVVDRAVRLMSQASGRNVFLSADAIRKLRPVLSDLPVEAAEGGLVRWAEPDADRTDGDAPHGMPSDSWIVDYHRIVLEDALPGGRGGSFGRMYRAQLDGDQTVAVRVLSQKRLDDRTMLQFQQEAALMRSVGQHDRLVKFVGACVTPPNLALVYELCETPLASILGRPNIPFGLVLRDVAEGLVHLHRHDVIHRNLSVSNVFVDTRTGHAKIGDLGFARLRTRSAATTMVSRSRAQHLAPELLKGTVSSSFSTDVFAFAVLAWRALHGSEWLSAAAIAMGSRPPWTSQELAPVAVRAVKQAWATDPAERPDAVALFEALTG